MCVEIRKCPFFDDLLNRTMIPRPRNVIKLIRNNQCGIYGNIPYVCCEIPTQRVTQPETTITTERRTTITTPFPINTQPQFSPNTTSLPSEPHTQNDDDDDNSVSDDNSETVIKSHPNYKLLSNDICGPIATDSRITSGSKATLNEYPWMALIAYDVGE